MRGFFITVLVALVIIGVIAWSAGFFGSAPSETGTPSAGTKTVAKKDWGPRLKGEEVPPEKQVAARSGADPTIIAGCRLNVIDEGDVPSRADNKVLFIGVPVVKGQVGYDEKRYFDIPNGLPDEELKLLPGPYSKDRFFKAANGAKMERLYFRPLMDNDPLERDQIVAVVDPTLQYTKVGIGQAKVTAAVSDYRGASALYQVYQEELERLDKIRAKDPKGVSEQEYNVARAQRDKYKADFDSKKEAIRVAQEELNEARIRAHLCFLRNTVVPSKSVAYDPRVIRIKSVGKKSGEPVKDLEPVLHVYNIGWLRAEGLLDGQYLSGLAEKVVVTVEPTYIRKPVRTFYGHRQAITCVAVSSDDKTPFIVTGSEDGTVRVWKRTLATEICALPHPGPVRAVACTSSKAKGNWCLSACADGSVRLWDLAKLSSDPSKPNEPVWERADQHKDGVNCIAFSPDGTMYATGGDDNAIKLWKTQKVAEGEKPEIYQLEDENGHQGAVTSLHFTPDMELVSAGRDNKLLVWTLREKGAELDEKRILSNRTGSVTRLGVDPRGQWMLFDQGRRLQVISRRSGRNVGQIQDPGEASPFESFAEFSPDASLVLTTTASDGKLQLWKAPTDGSRCFEVRRFKAKESGSPSCAAFGIDSTLPETRAEDADRVFVVTGTMDGLLHLWAVPGEEQVNKKLTGEISLRDASVDPSTGQGRVWVDVDNQNMLLKPGDSVTIVVDPQASN
jgi:WD40 repeat protein